MPFGTNHYSSIRFGYKKFPVSPAPGQRRQPLDTQPDAKTLECFLASDSM
jgi:hypothetical protein